MKALFDVCVVTTLFATAFCISKTHDTVDKYVLITCLATQLAVLAYPHIGRYSHMVFVGSLVYVSLFSKEPMLTVGILLMFVTLVLRLFMKGCLFNVVEMSGKMKHRTSWDSDLKLLALLIIGGVRSRLRFNPFNIISKVLGILVIMVYVFTSWTL